jgi:hypothetical protein
MSAEDVPPDSWMGTVAPDLTTIGRWAPPAPYRYPAGRRSVASGPGPASAGVAANVDPGSAMAQVNDGGRHGHGD